MSHSSRYSAVCVCSDSCFLQITKVKTRKNRCKRIEDPHATRITLKQSPLPLLPFSKLQKASLAVKMLKGTRQRSGSRACLVCVRERRREIESVARECKNQRKYKFDVYKAVYVDIERTRWGPSCHLGHARSPLALPCLVRCSVGRRCARRAQGVKSEPVPSVAQLVGSFLCAAGNLSNGSKLVPG